MKAATRKKPAAKKKAATKKRIAINAPSSATGKAPSKRLRSRRARNITAGAFPNPKQRAKTQVHLIYALGERGGEQLMYIFDGHKFVPSWAEGKRYGSKAVAVREMRRIASMVPPAIKVLIGAFPATQSDSAIYREFTGQYRGMGKP